MSFDFTCRLCGSKKYINDPFTNHYWCTDCSIVFDSPTNFSIPPIQWKKINDESFNLTYHHGQGDSGFDFKSIQNIILLPNKVEILSTGWKCAIPIGYELQIRTKSGLSSKNITSTNSPGTIDASYRGEVKVILINLNTDPYEIKIGDKIAQGVICKVYHPDFKIVNELSDTSRGEGGFGSTGK